MIKFREKQYSQCKYLGCKTFSEYREKLFFRVGKYQVNGKLMTRDAVKLPSVVGKSALRVVNGIGGVVTNSVSHAGNIVRGKRHHVGTTMKHVDNLYNTNQAVRGMVKNPTKYVITKGIAETGKGLGLHTKDIATPTGPVELVQKRLRAVKAVGNRRFRRMKAAKTKETLNRIAMDPGHAVADRVGEYVSSGGKQILSDATTVNRVVANVSNPITGGLGFYPADIANTAVLAGGAAIDKAGARYITSGGVPVQIGETYLRGAKKAGEAYRKHGHGRVRRLINTGLGATAGFFNGGQIPQQFLN